jgi:hypothetical protein
MLEVSEAEELAMDSWTSQSRISHISTHAKCRRPMSTHQIDTFIIVGLKYPWSALRRGLRQPNAGWHATNIRGHQRAYAIQYLIGHV